MNIKLNITYDAEKLEKELPRILDKLSGRMAESALKFYRKNTKKGLDYKGHKFKKLEDRTINMKRKKQGYYKKASKNKTLIATGNMLDNQIKTIFSTSEVAYGVEVRGYGAYHYTGAGNNKERKWFGASKYVFKNIMDNKKMGTFRKQIAKAFKK
jgi:hypothetical protein